MENIRFILDIMLKSSLRPIMKPAGNFLILPMHNGNVAKLCCESNGVRVEIIGKTVGLVDRVLFPFANYFGKKRCSPDAPLWDQCIENGQWRFPRYEHCLPTPADYSRLVKSVEDYLALME